MVTRRTAAIVAGVVATLFVAAAITVPLFFKDAVAARVRTEINGRVNADVSFSRLDLSLLRSFGGLTVSVRDLAVVGVGEFAGDQLASAEACRFTVSLVDLIVRRTTTMTDVTIDRPRVHLRVTKSGRANYDVLKPSAAADAGPSSFRIAIQSYALRDGELSYDNGASGMTLALRGLDHSGRGDFTRERFTVATTTRAVDARLWYGGVKYLNDVRLALDSRLDVDTAPLTITARETTLSLNDLHLSLEGTVAVPDDGVDADVTWSARENDVRQFLSLVPGVYREGFRDLTASGSMEMSGFVRGRISDPRRPAFGLTLRITDGGFKYPTLHGSVTNLQVDLDVSNHDGDPDHTVIDLKRLRADLASRPVEARLRLETPASDPRIDLMAKGSVDLGQVRTYLPLEEGTDLSGILSADIRMKGPYAAAAGRRVAEVQAAGTVALDGVSYHTAGAPPLAIRTMRLSLNPAFAALERFEASFGRSQVTATGRFEDLAAHFFKNAPLSGRLDLVSSLVDLDELRAAGPAPSEKGPLALPENIDLAVRATVAEARYDDLPLRRLDGTIALEDSSLDLRGLSFTMLDGLVTMQGRYETSNPAQPTFAYRIALDDMDIERTVAAFPSVGAFASVAERARGSFAAEVEIAGALDERNALVYQTLSGRGRVTIDGVRVANFEPLTRIAEALRMDDLRDLPLPRTVMRFNVRDGRLAIEPFETSLNDARARIEGSTGLDRSLAFTISLGLARDRLPPDAARVVRSLAEKAGGAVSLADLVGVDVKLGGTTSDPTVALALTSSAPSPAGVLAAEAQEAKTAAAAKLLVEAEARAAEIRAEARRAAERIRKEGYAAADRVMAEAGRNPIQRRAAERIAAGLRREADARAEKVTADAEASATALIETAKKKGGG